MITTTMTRTATREPSKPRGRARRPNRTIRALVTNSRLSDGGLRLLLHLLGQAGSEGTVEGSRRDLAAALGVGRETVDRRLAELAGLGFLTTEATVSRLNGGRGPNLVRLRTRG
jgi:hypothetical protein